MIDLNAIESRYALRTTQVHVQRDVLALIALARAGSRLAQFVEKPVPPDDLGLYTAASRRKWLLERDNALAAFREAQGEVKHD
jgi:hypothetical protein